MLGALDRLVGRVITAVQVRKDSLTPRVRNAMLGALDRLVGRVITAVQVRKDSPHS